MRGAQGAVLMPSLSGSLQQALQRAVRLASERHHEHATLEHLLVALIDDADAAPVMRACNVDLDALRTGLTKYVDQDLATLTIEDGEDAKPTTGFQRVVQRAVLHVLSSGRDQVTGANVLVALFSERECHAVYFLEQQNMSRLDAVNYMAHGIAKRPSTKATIDQEVLTSDEAYLATLRSLVERWCDERRLGALSRILPGYLALNGLTDGWPGLYEALKSTRALGHEAFSSADWDVLNQLIRGAERVLYFR
jgi:ATP-dependent Clp protease ATP-binding subunit ClpA